VLCDINLQNKVRLQNKVPPAELTIALSAVVLRIAPVADANDDVKVMTRISELLAVFSTAGLFNTAGSFVLDSAKKHVVFFHGVPVADELHNVRLSTHLGSSMLLCFP